MPSTHLKPGLHERAMAAMQSGDAHRLKAVVVEAVPAVEGLTSEVWLLEEALQSGGTPGGEHVRQLRMRISSLSARIAHYEEQGRPPGREGLIESFRNLQAKYRAKKAELRKAQQHIAAQNQQIRELKFALEKTVEEARRLAGPTEELEAQIAVLRKDHDIIQDRLAQYAEMVRERKIREAQELRLKLAAILPTLPLLTQGSPNECDAALAAWGVYQQVAEIIGAELPEECGMFYYPDGSLRMCVLANGHRVGHSHERPEDDDWDVLPLGDEKDPVLCGAPLSKATSYTNAVYCVRGYRHDEKDSRGHSGREEDRNR